MSRLLGGEQMLAELQVIICMKTTKALFGSLTLALGLCLGLITNGQTPITQTDKPQAKAPKLLADLRTKAEKDDAQTQNALAHAFLTGTLGVPKDEVEAVRWYYKAATQNDAQAQFSLGAWYTTNGKGVAKVYVLAYKWMLLAAAQGYPEAKKEVATLEGSLSQEQIAKGRKLAVNFKPQAVVGR